MSPQASSGNPLRVPSQVTFSLIQSTQMLSIPSSNRSTSTIARPFTAPAHKHAHHLHSIPPREKSTRTLIIDHMLWVHSRTRFAQARAELGMTDRTGGPSSFNYAHRLRPENFEEEEEELSDGEDVAQLKVRHDGVGENHVGVRHQEDDIRRRDLSLAQSLNLRAESLEKVVTAMLNQPPTIEPKHGDDTATSTSPRPHRHPHTLPNGVRLRLALGTVINDLFARSNQTVATHNRGERGAKFTTPHSQDFSVRSSQKALSDNFLFSLYPTLPPALIPLATISAAALAFMASSDRSTFAHSSPTTDIVSHSSRLIKVRLASNITPNTRAIYAAGAKYNLSAPSKCFRHLLTTCDICAGMDGKSPMTGLHKGRADSYSAGIGRDMNPRGVPIGLENGGITGWRDGSGIGSGLAKSVGGGTVLRRAHCINDVESGITDSLGLISRFLRLSALVAIELGNEARSGGTADNDLQAGSDPVVAEETSIRGYDSSRPDKQSQNRIYDDALRPSTEWYMLLAGLLTRTVLEGYLTEGWKGLDAVECLLSCGLRVSYANGKNEEPGEGLRNEIQDDFPIDESADRYRFEEFDPDELPTLQDAASILFPSLRSDFPQRKDGTEADYETEMFERHRMFLDIPSSIMDLRVHMENLAQCYPVEAVERAAVRFCEALAKWRGKPELETYKTKTATLSQQSINAEHLATTMESFVHSTPTSPVVGLTPLDRPTIAEIHLRKPQIEKYFLQIQTQGLRDNGRKRPRSPNIGRNVKRTLAR